MRLISWIIMLPLLVAVVAFSVSNRGRVEIDLWPLPFTYDLPVFVIGMAGLFIGFLYGAIIAWISGGKTRAFSRQLMRNLDSSRREELHLQEQIRKLEATTFASAPALSGKRSDAA